MISYLLVWISPDSMLKMVSVLYSGDLFRRDYTKGSCKHSLSPSITSTFDLGSFTLTMLFLF